MHGGVHPHLLRTLGRTVYGRLATDAIDEISHLIILYTIIVNDPYYNISKK